MSIFFGTSGPHDADIAIVGESWGKTEAEKQRPFVGTSGAELRKILGEVGIDPDQCFMTNVVSAQPAYNDMWRFFHPTVEAKKSGRTPLRGLYPTEIVETGLGLLREQLRAVNPKVIIGFGNYSLWALTEDCFSVNNGPKGSLRKVPTGIGNWRGSQLYTTEAYGNVPFLPTFHPASILRQWPNRFDIVHDLGARLPLALDNNWGPPPYRFIVRPSFEEVMDRLRYILQLAEAGPVRLSFDYETRNEHIACLGIAWTMLDALCIPFMCVERQEGYWPFEEEVVIVDVLRQIIRHPNVLIVGQNFLYDAQYTALYWGCKPRPFLDTMIAQHLCWPGRPRGLAYISSLYCAYHRYWKDEGKEWDISIPEEQFWGYNCMDAVTTFEASVELQSLVDRFGLRRQLDERMRQFDLALKMMLNGVRVDRSRMAQAKLDLANTMAQYEARFSEVIDETIFPPWPKPAKPWYRSPIQMRELFYTVFGQDIVRHHKTKEPTTDESALEKIKKREPLLRPICDWLIEYRSLERFHEVLSSRLDPDGRMRCSYDPTGTETFRYNSKKNAFGRGTNLQNLSEGSEE